MNKPKYKIGDVVVVSFNGILRQEVIIASMYYADKWEYKTNTETWTPESQILYKLD